MLELHACRESDAIQADGAVGIDGAACVEPKLAFITGSKEHSSRSTDGLAVLNARPNSGLPRTSRRIAIVQDSPER